MPEITSRTGHLLMCLENLALPEHSTVAGVRSQELLPPADVQIPSFDTAYQTTSFANSARLDFELHRPRRVDFMALAGVKVSGADPEYVRWSALLGQSAAAKSFAGAAEAVPAQPLVVRGDRERYRWEDPNMWFGGPAPDQVERLMHSQRLHTCSHFPGQSRVCRRVRLDLPAPDAAEKSGSYIRVPHVFFGEAFQPRVNFRWGASYGTLDLSDTQRSPLGVQRGAVRPVLRSFTFDLPFVSDHDAFHRILDDWYMRHGSAGRIFVWPFPDKPHLFYSQAFVGTVTKLTGPKIEGFWDADTDRNSMSFKVEETF
ncbi:MAG: hypothetical protein AAGN66_16205 [Acidobacteriota bacterium]